MVSPRLVVVEGPDAGAEFVVPEAGGGVGRGADNAVQLTDLMVSRSHCALAVRQGAVVLLDPGSRNRTFVNGQRVSEHVLAAGDEIVIGQTRLAFVLGERPTPVESSRVTWAAKATEVLRTDTLPPRRPGESPRLRERRHLGALYDLGRGLEVAKTRRDVVLAVDRVLHKALAARASTLLTRTTQGGVEPIEDVPATVAAPKDVVDTVVRDERAVLVDRDDARRGAEGRDAGGPTQVRGVGVPVGAGASLGVLYAEAEPGGDADWTQADVELVVCVAQLAGAALRAVGSNEALARGNRALEERLGGAPTFVGPSPAARAVRDFIQRVAATDSTVLIVGESGVGKELVAAAVHGGSRRASGPLVCVNCAALSEAVLESELFGHEKGAFTGAVERKVGRFELADGGTLFLDEVGELPLKAQAKFLRALEERRVERVGGTRSIACDVRVVAATNRDLDAMVAAGEFREDLYFRLCVLRATIPPLRERLADVEVLAEQLLAKLAAQMGGGRRSLSPKALEALRGYRWPGNVRELRNALEYAIVFGDGETIDLAHLPAHVVAAAPAARAALAPALATSPAPARSLRELEREGIVAALAATGGNKVQAAALLEIDRSTLYKKLKEYGIGGDA